MSDAPYTIRTMSRSQVDLAVEWAAREGWNPGLSDAACFHAADPQGFLVGEIAGRPVACISAVAYGEAFGFIGFYIVEPEFRGRGYGLEIWQAAMARLGGRSGTERLIGLDGVIAQQDNYRKSGFRLAYRNVRYQGRGAAGEASGLRPLDTIPFDEIEAYDRALFPAPRRAFLRQWLAMPGAHALCVRRGGRLAGYGVVRPCRTGWKIGPLFADDKGLAEALFAGLSARAAGMPVFLDVPEINHAAVALAERYSMSVVFETARMYTGPDPEVDLSRIFGVTTFELG
jgi:ribosomal protein S18 acetylase RimI-like enzyme